MLSIAIVCLVVLGVGALLLWLPTLMRNADGKLKASGTFLVKKIVIKGNRRCLRSEIIKALGLDSRQLIFSFSLTRARDRIKALPFVKHARLYRRLPDQLQINIEERQPIALFYLEKLYTASFAGQQDTYLWVVETDNIINTVRKCWASLFTPRAIDYRNKNDFPHEKVLISVGVQKMVNSRAAGVMFTLNPTNGDPSKVVIEGSWGLGETVVSGSVNPDKFVVDKVVMETSERTISVKHIQCVHDPVGGEVINVDVEEDMQSKCCLEDQEIKELVKTAKDIEVHYGRAMDIEWAIDMDFSFPENMFIVQARPETVWSQRKKEPLIGKKSGFQLLMDQAMKRIKIPG